MAFALYHQMDAYTGDKGIMARTQKQIKHAKMMNAKRVQKWRDKKALGGLIPVQVLIPPDALPQLRDLEKALRKGSRFV